MPSINKNNQTVKFTCENSRFRTDLQKGYSPVSRSGTRGSVTEEALYNDGEYSFWLEHIVEKKTEKNLFWFMWYKDGIPLLNMSGVFDEDDLTTVIQNISSIKF